MFSFKAIRNKNEKVAELLINNGIDVSYEVDFKVRIHFFNPFKTLKIMIFSRYRLITVSGSSISVISTLRSFPIYHRPLRFIIVFFECFMY